MLVGLDLLVFVGLLVAVMAFNLYNFHTFQKYQEQMAARVEDIQLHEKGKVVVLDNS